MSCQKPLGLRLDDHYRTMISQKQQQLKILAGIYPSVLWIRGPAGSGKTFLLIEKAVTLAKGILDGHSKANEKILVLCDNLILCKALEKTVKGKLPADKDVSSFLHFKTFSTLVMSLANYHEFPKSKQQKDQCVNLALENLQTRVESTSGIYYSMYDHILVDEGHDFYGNNWPKLLQNMHKNFHFPKDEFLAKPGVFWVMYDSNEHLYFGKERASLHCVYLRNSAKLNEVIRNTGNVFVQSMKYYKSLMPNDSPITLGHGLAGLPIEWDDSLVSRSDEEKEGAKSVIQWIKKLHKEKVHPNDICILVENEEKQRLLHREIEGIGEKCQTGDELVEKSYNCVVLETTRGFKGLESKVVILYNPPFQDDPSVCTKELLYTAVSRCSCFLVVISTQEGCMALKSDVDVNEESRGKRLYTSRLLRRAANVLQSQQQVDVNDVNDFSLCSHQESGYPERHFKQHYDDDDDDDDDDDEDVSFSEPLKISPDQIKMYVHHQKLREKQAASNEPRPKEVDGSNLIEPGDPNITDEIRGKVLTLLEEVVQESLKFIPGAETMDLTTIIASIEYKAYQKRRAECRPHNYTADLRKLKKEISACNQKGSCHYCVMDALESATKIRGMVFVEYFICVYVTAQI